MLGILKHEHSQDILSIWIYKVPIEVGYGLTKSLVALQKDSILFTINESLPRQKMFEQSLSPPTAVGSPVMFSSARRAHWWGRARYFISPSSFGLWPLAPSIFKKCVAFSLTCLFMSTLDVAAIDLLFGVGVSGCCCQKKS